MALRICPRCGRQYTGTCECGYGTFNDSIINIVREALPYAGYAIETSSTIVPSGVYAEGSVWIVRDKDESKPLLNWGTVSPLTSEFIASYGAQVNRSKYSKGIILSVTAPLQDEIVNARKHNIEIKSYDSIIDKISEEEQKRRAAKENLIRVKKFFEQRGGYSYSKLFSNILSKFPLAKTTNEKKKVLEDLIALFAQKLSLTNIKKDEKTPSSEIDVFAENNRTYGIWREFGTPILFECKNWDKHVTSNEIRNFVLKGTPAKTRFLIAWNSISGEDELKSSKLEIIKAKERGSYIFVLTKIDFDKIAGGIDPEFIVSEKYYELIKDKVLVTS